MPEMTDDIKRNLRIVMDGEPWTFERSRMRSEESGESKQDTARLLSKKPRQQKLTGFFFACR